MKPDISIVVPAYEEEDRVGDSLRKILSYAEGLPIRSELVVVDDGSCDKTAEVARQVCSEFEGALTKVIRYESNRGKGFAVKTGLLSAAADIALFSDADLSTPIE